MDTLPLEILEYIYITLEYPDLENLRKTCKINSIILSNNKFWKNKIKYDFYKNLSLPSHFDYKIFYREFYYSRCRSCFCKTNNINLFNGIRICHTCNGLVYPTLTQKQCYEEFCLLPKDLKDLKFLQKSKNGRKIYLKRDIQKLSGKLMSETQLQHRKKIRNRRRVKSKLKYTAKKIAFETELENTYNINLQRIKEGINDYTLGEYKKYFRCNTVSKEELIVKCVEYEYLMKYHIFTVYSTFKQDDEYYFDYYEFLLNTLLRQRDELVEYHPILKIRVDLLKEIYKDLFQRKKDIIERLDANKYVKYYDLSVGIVKRFIFLGTQSIDEVVEELELIYFLNYCERVMWEVGRFKVSRKDKHFFINCWYELMNLYVPRDKIKIILENIPQSVKKYFKENKQDGRD